MSAAARRRKADAAARELARFAAALNDSYPYPPDVRHQSLEELARRFLELAGPPAVRVLLKRPKEE